MSTGIQTRNPLFHPLSVFVVALSLSIGWGIRGNFGHESGAMVPGALAAMAAVILSRREDWWRRVAFFALFGGLGWGFGGSISYMYAISFSSSGHLPSIWYGYLLLFFEGALWAGMGGAGTALPAVADRERLTRMFYPLCFVLAALFISNIVEGALDRALMPPGASVDDPTWERHNNPLYWFDADWFRAVCALVGICVYDLVNRRCRGGFWLAVLAGGGAVVGYGVQLGLNALGWAEPVGAALTVPSGDTTLIDPATGEPMFPAENLLANWPNVFLYYPGHIGWLTGLVAGCAIYFAMWGRWRNDAGLFLAMALGWLVAFVAMPVLGTAVLDWAGLFDETGGFHLMPPRSDDWAGILGVFVATFMYTMRRGLQPVAVGASIAALLGGILFATAQVIRAMLIVPGHRWRTPGGTPPEWAHYQSANWHSVLEQMQGFGLGIAIAVMMAVLCSRMRPRSDVPPVRMWTENFAVAMVALGIPFLNLRKNAGTWTGGAANVPERMKAPFIESIELPAFTWYLLVWIAAAAAAVFLLVVHRRRPLAVIPSSWLGKGQLLYLVLLWVMVVGNFGRALPGFSQGRLVTEWVIAINACLATALLVYLSRPPEMPLIETPRPPKAELARIWRIGLPLAIVLMTLYTAVIYGVYGDKTVGSPEGSHKRWGPEAKWRIDPNLRSGKHQ